ncbi:hypothetical protein ScPMuIL_016569 [Solemya velum]
MPRKNHRLGDVTSRVSDEPRRKKTRWDNQHSPVMADRRGRWEVTPYRVSTISTPCPEVGIELERDPEETCCKEQLKEPTAPKVIASWFDDEQNGNITEEDFETFETILVAKKDQMSSDGDHSNKQLISLLLTIKNEAKSRKRKRAYVTLSETVRCFGCGVFIDCVCELLMSATLLDCERSVLLKALNNNLLKFDRTDIVANVNKILVVIEPLLIDESREFRNMANTLLSKISNAAGFAMMISTIRPDLDHVDEFVRNVSVRAAAIVVARTRVRQSLPFLKVVCCSKNSWVLRHSGMSIIKHLSKAMGQKSRLHLTTFKRIIENGLKDEHQKVRTTTALALAALIESITPYGIEALESVLSPIWKGIRTCRGKELAAFLKAVGCLISLMDAEYANYYTREVMLILAREFQSPDEQMKRIALKVLKQCCSTDGVSPQYIKNDILPKFFEHFWNQKMTLDRCNIKQLKSCTMSLAKKVGFECMEQHLKSVLARPLSSLITTNSCDHKYTNFEKTVLETIAEMKHSCTQIN